MGSLSLFSSLIFSSYWEVKSSSGMSSSIIYWEALFAEGGSTCAGVSSSTFRLIWKGFEAAPPGPPFRIVKLGLLSSRWDETTLTLTWGWSSITVWLLRVSMGERSEGMSCSSTVRFPRGGGGPLRLFALYLIGTPVTDDIPPPARIEWGVALSFWLTISLGSWEGACNRDWFLFSHLSTISSVD